MANYLNTNKIKLMEANYGLGLHLQYIRRLSLGDPARLVPCHSVVEVDELQMTQVP